MQIDGILIKATIAQRGLKCWQVAKQLNISDSYLSFILTGRRKASAVFLSRLGKFLNVDPRLLLILDNKNTAGHGAVSKNKHAGKHSSFPRMPLAQGHFSRKTLIPASNSDSIKPGPKAPAPPKRGVRK